MRTSCFAALVAVLLLIAVPSPASADSITVTGGFLDMANQLGRLSLSGDCQRTQAESIVATGGAFAPRPSATFADSIFGPRSSSLFGHGVASAPLRSEFERATWTPAEVHCDFGAANVVTPEPATLALFASGLLFAAGVIRRRPRH